MREAVLEYKNRMVVTGRGPGLCRSSSRTQDHAHSGVPSVQYVQSKRKFRVPLSVHGTDLPTSRVWRRPM